MANGEGSVQYGGRNYPVPEGSDTHNWVEENPQQMEETSAVEPTGGQLAGMGLKRQPAIAAGDVKTTSRETVEEGVPDDPRYQQHREEAHAARQGLAGMRGDIAIDRAADAETRLREQAVAEQEELQQRELQVSEAETAVREATGELDASIAQQREDWVQGKKATNLFDGGTGTGMVLASIGVALSGLGGAGMQGNAMQMVNQSLERSMRAQEFQDNSLFRQLENKYGDQQQARDALKMTQLSYANTMAEHYAAQNAAPEIVANLAAFQLDLMDEYQKTEDDFRAREFGKRTKTQDSRYQGGQRGGIVPLSTKEQMDQIQLKKANVDLLQAESDLAGQLTGTAAPESWHKDAQFRKELAGKEVAEAQFRSALQPLNPSFDEQGNLVKGSIRENNEDIPGVGFLESMTPDWLRSKEGVEASRGLKQAVVAMIVSTRGGRASDKAVKQMADEIIGGWSETDAAGGIEAAWDQLQASKAASKAAFTPDTLKYWEEVTQPAAKSREGAVNPSVHGFTPKEF